MREIFSKELSDQEADSRFQIYLRAYESHWSLFPDTLPCLKALHQSRLGIITNGEGEMQRSKLKKLELASYFSIILISREVNCSKPDSAIFKLAAEKAGEDMCACVYIGDRLQTDALSSQKAGMKGIWLNRKGQSVDLPLNVKVIPSLESLSEFLQGGMVQGGIL